MRSLDTRSNKASSLVVEDDAFFQSVIADALATCEPEVSPIFVASGQEALCFLEEGHVSTHLVLVDLLLPDMHGIHLIQQIRQRWPKLLCMVVSGSSIRESVLPAIEAGALGYIVKGDPYLSIGQAVSSVLEGLHPISPSLNSYLVDLLQNRKVGRVKSRLGLTTRECELLRHFAQGASYKKAARDMGVSVSTVQTHTRNLYRKLGARSSLQAVLRAKTEGLL